MTCLQNRDHLLEVQITGRNYRKRRYLRLSEWPQASFKVEGKKQAASEADVGKSCLLPSGATSISLLGEAVGTDTNVKSWVR